MIIKKILPALISALYILSLFFLLIPFTDLKAGEITHCSLRAIMKPDETWELSCGDAEGCAAPCKLIRKAYINKDIETFCVCPGEGEPDACHGVFFFDFSEQSYNFNCNGSCSGQNEDCEQVVQYVPSGIQYTCACQ